MESIPVSSTTSSSVVITAPVTTTSVECKTAEEFLEYLSPRSKWPVLGGREYYEWAFRGHAVDEKYKLLPLALRTEKNPFENLGTRPIITELDQIAAERHVLLRFCDYIDRTGLAVPEDSQNFRELLSGIQDHEFLKQVELGETVWIPKILYATAALAQHHGLPTRLLDWSYSHLAAAYFAAEEAARLFAAKKLEESLHLSVYAFSPDHLRDTCIISGRTPVVVVRAPRATNPNLHAQHGLFTMPLGFGFSPSRAVDRRPFDELIGTLSGSHLLRLRLPVPQAGRLLFQVSQEGINAATLFPGYGGIARAIVEASLWDQS